MKGEKKENVEVKGGGKEGKIEDAEEPIVSEEDTRERINKEYRRKINGGRIQIKLYSWLQWISKELV